MYYSTSPYSSTHTHRLLLPPHVHTPMSSQLISLADESWFRSTTKTELMSTKKGTLEQINSSVNPENNRTPIAFSVVSILEGCAKMGSSLISCKWVVLHCTSGFTLQLRKSVIQAVQLNNCMTVIMGNYYAKQISYCKLTWWEICFCL